MEKNDGSLENAARQSEIEMCSQHGSRSAGYIHIHLCAQVATNWTIQHALIDAENHLLCPTHQSVSTEVQIS